MGFWNKLATVLTNIALWAAEHPQVVQMAVTAATQIEAGEKK